MPLNRFLISFLLSIATLVNVNAQQSDSLARRDTVATQRSTNPLPQTQSQPSTPTQTQVAVQRVDANAVAIDMTKIDTLYQAVVPVKRDTVKAETRVAMPEKARKRWVPEWLFWMMLVQLALIVFVRVQYYREFNEVFTVFVNNALTQQLYRETQVGGMRMGYFLLNFNFIISLGTWAYLLFKYIGPNVGYADLQVLPFAIGLVGVLLVARFMALRMATWLLKSAKEIGLFNFTDLQLFRATGLLLFPVNAFLAYAPHQQRVFFLWFSLVLVVTFLLFRVLRGFEIGRTRLSANVFHFLVYICALEIAPVLVGIRLFLNTFGL